MNFKVRNRLIITLILFASITSGISLILYFLSDNIVFFITPSEISDKHLGKKIRIGGLVEQGSINKSDRGIIFSITDNEKSMKIKYSGILPGLFREGQGVVSEGIFRNKLDIFEAERLLTKHDENYKPPEKGKK